MREPHAPREAAGEEAAELDSDETSVPEETRLAAIPVPTASSEDAGPVLIQRQIQVPVTLGREEIVRGAKLRLTLEIRVEAASDIDAPDEDSRVA
jgi:hypothetical protein